MRLNKAVREAIVANALASLDKEKEALLKKEHALCERMYNHAVPKKTRDALATVPKKFLQWAGGSIDFNVLGYQITLKKDPDTPMADVTGWKDKLAVSDIALKELATALIDDKNDLKQRREVAQRTVEALVAGHTTTETLLEQWPQGRSFCRDITSKVVVNRQLPAVRIDELNRMLGVAA